MVKTEKVRLDLKWQMATLRAPDRANTYTAILLAVSNLEMEENLWNFILKLQSLVQAKLWTN